MQTTMWNVTASIHAATRNGRLPRCTSAALCPENVSPHKLKMTNTLLDLACNTLLRDRGGHIQNE